MAFRTGPKRQALSAAKREAMAQIAAAARPASVLSQSIEAGDFISILYIESTIADMERNLDLARVAAAHMREVAAE